MNEKEKEKIANEFMESVKIRLKQMLNQDPTFDLIRARIFRDFDGTQIRIEMSVENK